MASYTSTKFAAHSNVSSTSPSRTCIIVHCFLSFVICNIDRINLSIAIIPMSNQYGWSEKTCGLIQAAFFLGYMTTQIPGGRLADRHGGRLVLAGGVMLWSCCTALTPIASPHLPVLLFVRMLLGAGEGVAMPSMNALIGRLKAPRSAAISFVYSGMYAGSIVGLLSTPIILDYTGWQGTFYVFGAAGVLWVIVFVWMTKEKQTNKEPPSQAKHDWTRLHDEKAEEEGQEQEQETELKDTITSPSFGEIFSQKCMWGIIIAHASCTWGYLMLVAWLPTFVHTKFGVEVKQSAILSTIPWLVMFACANVSGWIADEAIRRGASVTRTRKIMQTIGFAGPAACLWASGGAKTAGMGIGFIAGGLGLASFSQSGVYSNHQDIGPGVAGTLLGISNSFAACSGLVSVSLTGFILDSTQNKWSTVFGMAIMVYVGGLVAYLWLGSSQQVWL